MRMPRLNVLVDFNIHIEAASEAGTGIHGIHANHGSIPGSNCPTHETGCLLDLMFCICLGRGALIIRNVVKKSLSWSRHWLLKVKASVTPVKLLDQLGWSTLETYGSSGFQNSLGDITTDVGAVLWMAWLICGIVH